MSRSSDANELHDRKNVCNVETTATVINDRGQTANWGPTALRLTDNDVSWRREIQAVPIRAD
jgi:hypothetical protein